MKVKFTVCSLIILLTIFCSSCKQEAKPKGNPTMPEVNEQNKDMMPPPEQPTKGFYPSWTKNAVIYEVNLRQYTPEGTFKAFEAHIPRLADMGVDVLWFMPIYPISKAKRKGKLGSYYAVSDYRAVNPEHGTMRDFRSLVRKAHSNNMKIIIDWVPNHTGWDHKWIKLHPQFYTKNKDGEITDPIDPSTGEPWGWTDVADLDYDNADMRKAMLDDMEFWVTKVGIDGFRQDVAHGVPLDFWVEYRKRMMKHKQLFHLAEAEIPEHRNQELFHASYGWSFHHLLNEIAQGKKGASEIKKWYDEDRAKFIRGFHMHFTSNHDENSWSGTEYERMGTMAKLMAVLTCTFDGTPLIYSGQEEPLKKRLEFFEKDVIPFEKFRMMDFYKKLLLAKHSNKALWNGPFGVEPEFIRADDDMLIFRKQNEGETAVVVLNFNKEEGEYTLPFDMSNMVEVMSGRLNNFNKDEVMKIDGYGYHVFTSF